MYRAGGARMFWLGNMPGLIRIVPHAGLKFASYEVLGRRLINETSPSVYRARFLTGTLAGGIASVLLYPLDVLKSTMTLVKFTHLAAGDKVPPLAWIGAARDLWARGGATRGLGISVVGSSIHNGFLFMGYYSMRSWWMPTEHRFIPYLASGVFAGTFAQITYPLDLIRRTALHKRMHAYDTARMLINEGGVLALYRGSVANLAKVAPYFGLQFMLYELLLSRSLIGA